MPSPLHDQDPDVALEAERDIKAILGEHSLDFDALAAISNIYRAATAVRNRMEREVLTPAGLTWGGFTILFVLWVWGDREPNELATDCGVAKGTLSGMLATLERAGMVNRSRHPDDGRRVIVSLEKAGEDQMDDLFPKFNEFESLLTEQLDTGERRELSRLLRLVTATADEVPLLGS